MPNEQIFNRVLLAIDGSLPSIIAEELTVFLAKRLGSKVSILNVISNEFTESQVGKYGPTLLKDVPLGTGGAPEDRVYAEPMSGISEALTREITMSNRQRGRDAIEEALALFKEEKVSVDQILAENTDPAESITREAEKGNFDLVVVGYSSEEEKEPHLGSVAKKTALYAKTSVLIAREKKQISKIMVAVDGSKHSIRLVHCAAILARELSAEVTLLNVQESDLPPEIVNKVGTRILSEAVARFKEAKLNQKLSTGDPAKTIIQEAREGDYDLIIVGHKGHNILSRFLLGSVSDHVIHYADRSVLLIR